MNKEIFSQRFLFCPPPFYGGSLSIVYLSLSPPLVVRFGVYFLFFSSYFQICLYVFAKYFRCLYVYILFLSFSNFYILAVFISIFLLYIFLFSGGFYLGILLVLFPFHFISHSPQVG